MFNYQGSSLFLLIRSSSDILSRRFSLVKNFFIFLFAVCSGFFLPHKSAYLDYHIGFSLSRTFFTLYSDLLSHPVPQRLLGLFFSSVCLSDKWYLITGKMNCQCFFCFLFFSHNSDNSLLFYLRYHAAHILSFISPNTKQQPSKTLHILTLLHHNIPENVHPEHTSPPVLCELPGDTVPTS